MIGLRLTRKLACVPCSISRHFWLLFSARRYIYLFLSYMASICLTNRKVHGNLYVSIDQLDKVLGHVAKKCGQHAIDRSAVTLTNGDIVVASVPIVITTTRSTGHGGASCQHGGHNRERFMLTVDAFKQLCMLELLILSHTILSLQCYVTSAYSCYNNVKH